MNRRRVCMSLFALVLSCVLAMPVLAAPIVRDGIYLIQMAGSQMTVAASSGKKGARLVLHEYRPSATWLFSHQGGNVYRITTNAMAMDLSEGKRRNGVPIVIWPKHNGKNQLWKVVKSGKYYSLINVQTGLALDLSGNHRKAGNTLQGYSRNNSEAQRFSLKKR